MLAFLAFVGRFLSAGDDGQIGVDERVACTLRASANERLKAELVKVVEEKASNSPSARRGASGGNSRRRPALETGKCERGAEGLDGVAGRPVPVGGVLAQTHSRASGPSSPSQTTRRALPPAVLEMKKPDVGVASVGTKGFLGWTTADTPKAHQGFSGQGPACGDGRDGGRAFPSTCEKPTPAFSKTAPSAQ